MSRYAAVVIAIALTFGLATLAQAQTIRTLYTFTGGSDGYSPTVGLVADTAGNLYGGTFFGGTVKDSCGVGCGTVFQLARNGGKWSFNTLHSFTGGTTDVGHPTGPLAFDLSGNLYGGGQTSGATGYYGGIFELSRSPGWNESVIYSFTQQTGLMPSGVVFYRGSLYGATTFGPGSNYYVGNGTIYRLFQDQTGQWQHNLLYAFKGGNDGYEPSGSLVFDQQGNLYGATPYGGTGQTGDIFELSQAQPGLTFSVIDDAAAGWMIFGKDGNIYTTVPSGGSGHCGAFACGSVIELQRTSTGWNPITLYDFTDETDGDTPESIVFDSAGNLYGTTFLGGTGSCKFYSFSGCGTVFKLTPGTNGWQKTTVYNFTGGRDGEFPNGNPLVISPAGNLYGATEGGASFGGKGYGTIFEIQS